MKKKDGGAAGKHRVRVLFPISVKLVISFTLILFTVLFIINDLNSGSIARNLELIAEEANFTTNNLYAAELEERFNSIRKEAHLLLDFIRIAGRDSYAARQASAIFFERSYFIAAVCVPGYIELVDDFFFITNNVNPGAVSSWVSREGSRIQRAREGEPVISNPSPALGVPLIAMFYPWQQNDREDAVIILFSPDILAEIFGMSDNACFLVNSDADVLIHHDYSVILEGSNASEHPLYTAFLNSGEREIKMTYAADGVKYFGAAKKLSLAGMAVLSSAEYDAPSAMASAMSRRNYFLIGSFIFIAVVLIWLLSKTITVPLYRIIEVVSRLEEGEFDRKLSYRFPDEIGLLSDTVNAIGDSLAEKIPEKREPARKRSRK